jgi:hypothetical protein
MRHDTEKRSATEQRSDSEQRSDTEHSTEHRQRQGLPTRTGVVADHLFRPPRTARDSVPE